MVDSTFEPSFQLTNNLKTKIFSKKVIDAPSNDEKIEIVNILKILDSRPNSKIFFVLFLLKKVVNNIQK